MTLFFDISGTAYWFPSFKFQDFFEIHLEYFFNFL